MSCVVQVLSEVERKFILTVAAADIEKKFKHRLLEVARNTRWKGYRPGNFNLKEVEAKVGPAIREEVLKKLLGESLEAACTAENYDIAGIVNWDPVEEKKTGEDLVYSVTVEVLPKIHLDQLKGLEVERVEAEVTDADLDEMLERLRKQQGTWVDSGMPAQDGDQVLLNFEGKLADGSDIQNGKAVDLTLVLGSKRMIPGFEEALLGALPGDLKEFSLSFPADYSVKNLANQSANFKVEIKAVKRLDLPVVDEQLIKNFGVETLEEFRAGVRRNMQRELKSALKRNFKAAVSLAIAESKEVMLPASLVKKQIQQLREEMLRRLGKGQAPSKKADLLPDSFFESAARAQIKAELVLRQVIADHKISPNSEEIFEFATELASIYEDTQGALQNLLYNKESVSRMSAMASEQLAIEKIAEILTVKVVQKSFEEVIMK